MSSTSSCSNLLLQNRRQQINLPNMVCGMEQVAEDGFDHAVRLIADVDSFGKVFVCQGFEGGEEDAPAFFPALHHQRTIVAYFVQKLARALTVGFFAIAGQEISPA